MLKQLLIMAMIPGMLAISPRAGAENASPAVAVAAPRVFAGRGVIQQIPADQQTVVIKHEAISNYMAAMTMPFNVRDVRVLAGLQPGDKISFRLNVTADESWVDQLRKTGTAAITPAITSAIAPKIAGGEPPAGSFMNYALTNELGQKFTLRDFRGQALAITFFYTRCPLPDFCPRLAKNFQAATAKLRDLPGGPTNWHFLSISFDTDFDTPAMLEAYGNAYGYRPKEWSFATGSPAVIRDLATISGVTYTANGGGFQHNFRTLIVDTTGRLQRIFPMGGNIADDIVTQMVKAAGRTNEPSLSTTTH